MSLPDLICFSRLLNKLPMVMNEDEEMIISTVLSEVIGRTGWMGRGEREVCEG